MRNEEGYDDDGGDDYQEHDTGDEEYGDDDAGDEPVGAPLIAQEREAEQATTAFAVDEQEQNEREIDDEVNDNMTNLQGGEIDDLLIEESAAAAVDEEDALMMEYLGQMYDDTFLDEDQN